MEELKPAVGGGQVVESEGSEPAKAESPPDAR